MTHSKFPANRDAGGLIDWEKDSEESPPAQKTLPDWVMEDERAQLAKDYKDPLEIRESPIHGLGLFALAPFDKGDIVCRALRRVRSTGIADFDLLQTRWGRKINHLEDPNARPEADPETGDVLVVARRGIDKDDEITVDYDEFGEAVGKMAESLPAESRIEVSPGKLQTALSRRRRPLSEIVSFEPPTGKDADDGSLVDVRKHGLVTEDGHPLLLDAATADALASAQEDLPEGISIMVMDGFRSQEDQARIVRETAAKLKKSHPDDWKHLLKKYTGGFEELREKPGSMDHRSGRAVDIKLIGSDGEELELGGMSMNETDRLDHYETKAPTNRHEAEVKRNRDLLRRALEKQGFRNNPEEWWHWGYETPISATAASMKHPGPSWQQHPSLMSFLPVRKNPPPGFQKVWNLEKNDRYRWLEGGAFTSNTPFVMPAKMAEQLVDLAMAEGWKLPHRTISVEYDPVQRKTIHTVAVAPYAEELAGKRRMRLGRLIQRLKRFFKNEGDIEVLEDIGRRYEKHPKANEWMLIVSAEPSDLRTISTGRGWRSCMQQDQMPPQCMPELESSIGSRDLVAYAVDKRGDWLARSVLRFDGKGGWWPDKVYGQPSSIDFKEFKAAVTQWLKQRGLYGEEGRVSPFFKGWTDWLEPVKKERPPEEQAVPEMPESEPPEKYKGPGRALMPQMGPKGGEFLITLRQPLNDKWYAEQYGEAIERGFRGRVKFLGVWTGIGQDEFPLLFHVETPETVSAFRNHPYVKTMVRTASTPLSKRAGRRPGVDKEFIWVWDDGIREGFGRAHGGRLVVVQNVENGMELPGVDHAAVIGDIGLSGDDSQRIHRGFVTYNADGSTEVAMYGAPFGSLLKTAPRAYNVLEERFGLLPGSYRQVVLPMPRGSYKEFLKERPTGTGDADDGGFFIRPMPVSPVVVTEWIRSEAMNMALSHFLRRSAPVGSPQRKMAERLWQMGARESDYYPDAAEVSFLLEGTRQSPEKAREAEAAGYRLQKGYPVIRVAVQTSGHTQVVSAPTALTAYIGGLLGGYQPVRSVNAIERASMEALRKMVDALGNGRIDWRARNKPRRLRETGYTKEQKRSRAPKADLQTLASQFRAVLASAPPDRMPTDVFREFVGNIPGPATNQEMKDMLAYQPQRFRNFLEHLLKRVHDDLRYAMRRYRLWQKKKEAPQEPPLSHRDIVF